jgi:hypothetical protein
VVQLVCIFSTVNELDSSIELIKRTYSILYGKIFILELENSTDLICTFNIDKNLSNSNTVPGSMLLHRKKETNTLYTINSLNKFIENEIGHLDKRHQVDWNKLENSLMIITNYELKIYPTKLYRVIHVR